MLPQVESVRARNRAFFTARSIAVSAFVHNRRPRKTGMANLCAANGCGAKFTFTAERAGMLHFGIALAGNHANHAFPGQYSVKVVVRRR